MSINSHLQLSTLLDWYREPLKEDVDITSPVVLDVGNTGCVGFILRILNPSKTATAMTWTVQRYCPVTKSYGDITTQVFDATGLSQAAVYSGTIVPTAEFDLELPLIGGIFQVTLTFTGAEAGDVATVYQASIRGIQ